VKRTIYDYPALYKKRAELLRPRIITQLGAATGGGSGEARPVEYYVERELGEQDEREYNAVRRAVEQTENGDVLKIIELVFWSRSHTLNGAADQVHVSYVTAKRYQEKFIKTVAKNLGLF
jgi:hypothetical protein